MKLKVVTPERIVFEDPDVEAVYANTVDGEVGILPKHVPLVTPLAIGVLRYVKAGQKEPIAVMGGLLRTNGKEVTILCEAAERADEIDALRAQHAKERAEARLKQQTNDVDVKRAKTALMRSVTRLKLASAAGMAPRH